jgi:carbonyl reductase 1
MLSLAGATARWWTKDTVVVVTGANKGIGFELTRQLAKNGLTTVLTSRDEERGKDAVEVLKREGLDVAHHPLDVQSEDSARKFADWIKYTYGGLDILVNNAGVAKRAVNVENLDLVMQTNYFGVKNVTQALLPLFRPSSAGSRVVIVASRSGLLRFLNNKYRQELADREHLTEEKLDDFVKACRDDVVNGTWEKGGWAERNTTYNVSKVAVNGYVTVLDRALRERPEGAKVYVNSFCPGLTKTDMTEGKGSEDIEGAVQTGLLLALLSPGGPSGKFWADGQEVGWD